MLGSVALRGKRITIMVTKRDYVNVIFKFCVIVSVCVVRQFISQKNARVVCMWLRYIDLACKTEKNFQRENF